MKIRNILHGDAQVHQIGFPTGQDLDDVVHAVLGLAVLERDGAARVAAAKAESKVLARNDLPLRVEEHGLVVIEMLAGVAQSGTREGGKSEARGLHAGNDTAY